MRPHRPVVGGPGPSRPSPRARPHRRTGGQAGHATAQQHHGRELPGEVDEAGHGEGHRGRRRPGRQQVAPPQTGGRWPPHPTGGTRRRRRRRRPPPSGSRPAPGRGRPPPGRAPSRSVAAPPRSPPRRRHASPEDDHASVWLGSPDGSLETGEQHHARQGRVRATPPPATGATTRRPPRPSGSATGASDATTAAATTAQAHPPGEGPVHVATTTVPATAPMANGQAASNHQLAEQRAAGQGEEVPVAAGGRARRPTQADRHSTEGRVEIEDQGHQESHGGDHGHRSRIGQRGRGQPRVAGRLGQHRPPSQHPDDAGAATPAAKATRAAATRARSRPSRLRTTRNAAAKASTEAPNGRKAASRRSLTARINHHPRTETDGHRRPMAMKVPHQAGSTRARTRSPPRRRRPGKTHVPVHGGGQDADHHWRPTWRPRPGTWQFHPVPMLSAPGCAPRR